MKRPFSFLLSLFLMLSVLSLPVYADHGGSEKSDCCASGHCPMKKDEKDGSKSYGCPLMDKFMKKAHFLLENQEALGLSEEQVSTIKQMKMDRKKAFIRQKAEFEIFQMDLEQKLSQPKVDVEGINAMIDQSMAAMNTNAKEAVSAYAKLKGVVSDSQWSKAKELKKHH